MWEYFPQKKGLYSGILMGAYGLGGFIFALLTTYFTNPNDDKMDIVVDKHDGTTPIKFFGPEVADNVPSMLRKIGTIWSILIILSVLLISRRQTSSLSK